MKCLSQRTVVIVSLLMVIQTIDSILSSDASSTEVDDCVFQYMQQPPSWLSCNPYNNATSPPRLQVILACGAQINDLKKEHWTFDFRWFSNYSSRALDHVSDVCTPSFINQSLLVISPGQYWCQVLDYMHEHKAISPSFAALLHMLTQSVNV